MEQNRMKLEEDIFKNNSEIVIYTKTEEETKKVGKELAKILSKKIKRDKEIIHICLIGDLGVRKN